MIEPGTYSPNFYSMPAARAVAQASVSKEKTDAADQAAAADFARILNDVPAISAAPPATGQVDEAENTDHSFIGFIKDVIDVINPLQHIPVISAIYRHLTGDEIGPMARIAGDTLFGGPIGAALALADIASQQSTGKDIGETIIASLTGKTDKKEIKEIVAETVIAQNTVPDTATRLNDQISPAAGNLPPSAPDSGVVWSTPYGQKYHEPPAGPSPAPEITPQDTGDGVIWHTR